MYKVHSFSMVVIILFLKSLIDIYLTSEYINNSIANPMLALISITLSAFIIVQSSSFSKTAMFIISCFYIVLFIQALDAGFLPLCISVLSLIVGYVALNFLKDLKVHILYLYNNTKQ